MNRTSILLPRAEALRQAIEASLYCCTFCRSGRYNCGIEGHRILWAALDLDGSHPEMKPIHGFEH